MGRESGAGNGSHQADGSPTKAINLPEITVKALVLGVLLSVILAGANAYLGLFAGMTVSASIPAAVISMGVLRLFGKTNILENNIVQTAASAGESLAAGVIFTIPALVLMGYWTNFPYLWVTLICGLGGLIGVLFTIPLRRALIVEGSLKFPEGVATAEVLEAGERGGRDVTYIAMAGLAGAIFKFGETGLKIWPGVVEGARRMGTSMAYFGSNLSPALISVGFIVGINIAVLVFLGGALNWLVAIPIVAATAVKQYGWPIITEVANSGLPQWMQFTGTGADVGTTVSAVDWANEIWSGQTRYIGVGAMVVGGLWALISLRGALFQGITSGLTAYRSGKLEAPVKIPRTEQDAPMKWILFALVLSLIPIFALYQSVVGSVGISLTMAILMLIAGFLFCAVAAYMAGLVGSSNNPISGVTIATILLSSLLLLAMMGSGNTLGPPAAILIGAVVCCAAAIGGDNMQDLKAGHILGATPWKQQVMQGLGTISAAFVMAPILMLLHTAYGFGPATVEHPNALAAPQATLMQSVAEGVFAGNLPWTFIIIGAIVAVGIISLDQFQKRRGSAFRFPVLAVAVGIYLPFELSVPILAGGLIAVAVGRAQRRFAADSEAVTTSKRRGLLFASGLITGEALVGILMAIPIVVTGKEDVLALFSDPPLKAWPGVLLLAGVIVWLYRVATKSLREAR
ncbi:MAG: oligopeptide transporter, OPT family [Candidatus Eisenbacteria bacterium]|uniref:Oligopeptide transporter, OPT family n=1 Tax=Eiseniibacteriota bacterium TaxID=2212470 RepID=A0A948RZD2_UNCEI|nr:oligopeptide transporter, OPT family [Candidatus Eisenbacteria bacterium]MBU1949947.1 oligopeptide transporter, OPT family [Candidatus Eisenbacteria bacterium]MBU2692761.1 oligopeptide transporter, OPT family [Candidatus Eisenbacteria bacterium]